MSSRRGIGSLLVLTMVLLLVLLALALGHDRFSSQVLWTSQKSTEGALATILAENAVEESRYELGRRVNVAGDPLYLFFRKGQGRRPVDGLRLSHAEGLLKDEAYKRYNFEGEPADVEIVSQEPFGAFGFETKGVLRYFSSVTGYPLRNAKDKVVRQVEVRQEFKVSLIGPPTPFDRMLLYIHNGHEYLGLQSSDEWVNTNKLLEKMHKELIEIRKNRDEQKQKLLDNAEHKSELPGYDDVMADLDNMKFPALETLARYESAYGRKMQFPEEPMALVALNTSGNGFKLDELGSDAWFRLEADWRERKRKADDAEKKLRQIEGKNWDAGLIRKCISIIDYLNVFDNDMITKRIYPLYFSSCKVEREPRLIYNVIEADRAPGGGSALAHYRNLLATFARDRVDWRQKFFFHVKKSGPDKPILAELEKFRFQQDPAGGVLNGVVHVDNPDEPLVLAKPIPGKLVLVVEGDVVLANLPRADEKSLLTVISYGTMSVEGEVNASLIPRGNLRMPAGPPVVRGNLILDESYRWPERTPRLTGQLLPDLMLVGSAETAPGQVAIYPDRQLVVLSPTTEVRTVSRAGEK